MDASTNRGNRGEPKASTSSPCWSNVPPGGEQQKQTMQSHLSRTTKEILFSQVYSIDVRENVAVPRLLIDLGREVVGGEGMPVHYRSVQEKPISVQ